MDSKTVAPPRSKEVAIALSKLTEREMKQLKEAANGYYEGGEVLDEPLRSKAVEMELVYKSSGRLRADVYKLLRTDNVVLVWGR